MLRTHNCNSLNSSHINEKVTLTGWVQKTRDLGGMTFVDLRDRYGITQITFNMKENPDLCLMARKLGREFVIQVSGIVIERSSKNKYLATGGIEIDVNKLVILNESKTPPFTIEENTDGGDELRMKYRYLDIRRKPIQKNLILRHKVAKATRNYLDKEEFIEVETPYLIKSTPEGARDFIVPSRMNEKEFYALPQSPQTFKQLLMVAGMDKYYQIVKCFRDEDLRADRQPEFTQIDCEMSFVDQEDIINTFERLIKSIFIDIHNIELEKFDRISYNKAIELYGSDKPDTRFDMTFVEMTELCKQSSFEIFNSSEIVLAINVKKGADFTRKQLDSLIKYVKTPQIGAAGLAYCKYNLDGTSKSTIDKFFDENIRKKWAEKANCENGDLLLIMSGDKENTRKALGLLRIHIAEILGLRSSNKFCPLWVTDFPLLQWDENEKRWHSMHHPFTAPHENEIKLLDKNPELVKANAYDLVINGNEIGGGSIRIHDQELQKKIFKILGLNDEEAQKQFGFLTNAFEYGAPPHGGIAFGFDRLCAVLGGQENIRDFIAFPKNNSGRDIMIDSPSEIHQDQLNELNLKLNNEKQ